MEGARPREVISLAIALSLINPNPSLAAAFPDYIKAGEAAYHSGDRVKAEMNFALALKEAERSEANGLEAAEALTDLGVIYDETQRYAEAESAYKRSLAIREKHYGTDHMAVATTINNLANLYKDQKKYKEAEPLYKRSMDICKKMEASNSDFLAMSNYNLAKLYQLQNRYEESIPFFRSSLQFCEKSSASREHLMDVIGNFGLAYDSLGKSADAQPLFTRYFNMASQILGLDPSDPKTESRLKEFAADQRKSNDQHIAELTEKAIEYHRKSAKQ